MPSPMFGLLPLGPQLAVEWQRFFDQDHNPDFNPHGVDVWKMIPQGEPPEVLKELFWQKMRELDPDGSRWRGSHMYTGQDPHMQPMFRLRRPPPPPMMGGPTS